jgi:hypothetical protein
MMAVFGILITGLVLFTLDEQRPLGGTPAAGDIASLAEIEP